MPLPTPRRPAHYRSIQIAPDGRRLYLVEVGGDLHAWDLAGSPGDAELRASEASSGFPSFEGISILALRPDGAILAVGDRNGTVTLIDTERRTVVGSVRPSADEPESFFLTLAFSPDGRTLAVGSQQGTISLYAVDRPARPELLLRLTGHRGRVINLVFDAQGTRLASAGDGSPRRSLGPRPHPPRARPAGPRRGLALSPSPDRLSSRGEVGHHERRAVIAPR